VGDNTIDGIATNLRHTCRNRSFIAWGRKRITKASIATLCMVNINLRSHPTFRQPTPHDPSSTHLRFLPKPILQPAIQSIDPATRRPVLQLMSVTPRASDKDRYSGFFTHPHFCRNLSFVRVRWGFRRYTRAVSQRVNALIFPRACQTIYCNVL